jgi:hypothetical protein
VFTDGHSDADLALQVIDNAKFYSGMQIAADWMQSGGPSTDVPTAVCGGEYGLRD